MTETPETSCRPDQLPALLDCVHEGWHPLLLGLHAELTALWPEYRVGQVKEKWGALRVYLGYRDEHDGELLVDQPTWEACHAAVTRAEDRSLETCELCGEPGQLRQLSWLKTLCDGCAAGAPVSTKWQRRVGPNLVVHGYGEAPPVPDTMDQTTPDERKTP